MCTISWKNNLTIVRLSDLVHLDTGSTVTGFILSRGGRLLHHAESCGVVEGYKWLCLVAFLWLCCFMFVIICCAAADLEGEARRNCMTFMSLAMQVNITTPHNCTMFVCMSLTLNACLCVCVSAAVEVAVFYGSGLELS